MNCEFGIIQGRLLPPVGDAIQAFPTDGWRSEFDTARQLGIRYIEWVYDVVTRQSNPLVSDEGATEIRAVSERTGVTVRSVCADYFRDRPVIRADAHTLSRRYDELRNLIRRCSAAGIRRLMIPFVDHAAIADEREFDQAVTAFREVMPAAETYQVRVTMENALASTEFRSLLEAIDHPLVGVTYDIGDRASLGCDLAEDIAVLAPWIDVVHIKDRQVRGASVPLGTGDADFAAAFRALAAANYRGPYILQCAREKTGQEQETARQNMRFVLAYL